jgi:hypothetical protein
MMLFLPQFRKEGVYKSRGYSVLEISLARYRNTALDELDDIVLDLAPRSLIHSSEVKAMAAKIAEARQRQEDAKTAEAQHLVEIYREGDPRNHRQAQSLVDTMVRRGLSTYIDIEDDRPSAFIVYRRQWQAAIFDKLFQNDYDQPISAYDIAEAWSGRWTKPGLRYVKSDHSRWIADEIADDFKSPYEEVAAFLARLKAAEVVYKASRGGAYYMHHRFKSELEAVIEKEALPARRRGQLLTAFQSVGAVMHPHDGSLGSSTNGSKGGRQNTVSGSARSYPTKVPSSTN